MILSAMYQTIWKDYRKRFYAMNPRLPEERTFSVGRALWALSRHKGLKFVEVAHKTGIAESSLLRMSCSHKLTSTMERVHILSNALGVQVEEFFESAREEFFGNFFITKSAALSSDQAREYAKEGIFLHQQIVTAYPDSKSPDFKVIVYTPPIESLVDLFSATFFISSGKELAQLKLPVPADLYMCVINGLVEIFTEAGEKSGALKPGQSVRFDGSVEHIIRNLSDTREAEILVSFMPTCILSLSKQKSQKYGAKVKSFDIPALIDRLRERVSSSLHMMPISLSDLALQAGLQARGLDLLSKGSVTNLPIERFERLAELAHVPMEAMLSETPFQRKPFFKITKGVNRGIHDYRSQYGARFFPWVRMGTEDRKLFLGEVSLEPPFPAMDLSRARSGAEFKEKVWEGNVWGYLLAKGLSGKVEAHIGKRHIYPDIDREDTVYLDMSLGFSFRNFSPSEQTSLFLVSSPPLF